jgi:hypothetical protein
VLSEGIRFQHQEGVKEAKKLGSFITKVFQISKDKIYTENVIEILHND